MRAFIFLFSSALLASGASAGPWLDQGHDIFFPREMRREISVHFEFSAFWWNFIVVEGNPSPIELCQALKSLRPSVVTRVECRQELADQMPYLVDWQRDQKRREPWAGEKVFLQKLRTAYAQVSLPMTDRQLLDVLRVDPLGAWRDLLAQATNGLRLNLALESGFFRDSSSGKIVIPVLMAASPQDTSKTRTLVNTLRAAPGMERAEFVGPHASSLANEQRITADTDVLSWVGVIVTLVLCLVLFAIGRWRLILLLPPVVLSTGLAALLVVWMFGSIHGITLAFGVGIVGLAFDYGLHGAMHPESRTLWRSNLSGFIAVMAGLGILGLSEVPMIRQLMIFSMLGLGISFAVLYLCITRYPKIFGAKQIQFSSRLSRRHTIPVVILALCSIVGWATVRPTLELRSLDYQTPSMKTASEWLYHVVGFRPPLFALSPDATALTDSLSWIDKTKTQAPGVRMQTLGAYLPPEENQKLNLTSWDAPCHGPLARLESGEKKLFSPFIESLECGEQATPLDGTNAGGRSYVQHLSHGGQWLTLWFPQSDSDEARVRALEPQARSVRDVAALFPTTLGRELRWMTILTLCVSLCILWFHYRSAKRLAVSLVPFFSGTGMVFVASWVFAVPLSFVGLVAMIMLFGMSFDYGIFAADSVILENEEDRRGVAGALTLATVTNLAGFFPLLFCLHPVLQHLGYTLFFGALGTYLGAVWGVPGLLRMGQKYA